MSIALLAPSWAVLVQRELLRLSCHTGILTSGSTDFIEPFAARSEQDYGPW